MSPSFFYFIPSSKCLPNAKDLQLTWQTGWKLCSWWGCGNPPLWRYDQYLPCPNPPGAEQMTLAPMQRKSWPLWAKAHVPEERTSTHLYHTYIHLSSTDDPLGQDWGISTSRSPFVTATGHSLTRTSQIYIEFKGFSYVFKVGEGKACSEGNRQVRLFRGKKKRLYCSPLHVLSETNPPNPHGTEK